jgi:hypothetical protein
VSAGTTRSLVAAGLAVAILCFAPTASGLISTNTIDRQVTYTKQGTRVHAGGPIACTRGEWVTVRATVTQTATHARASGRWEQLCKGHVQRWRIVARAHGRKPLHWQVRQLARGSSFARGRARVCAVAKTRLGRRITDRRVWCVRVNLSPRS